jgi:hypothetical protein
LCAVTVVVVFVTGEGANTLYGLAAVTELAVKGVFIIDLDSVWSTRLNPTTLNVVKETDLRGETVLLVPTAIAIV